MIYRLQNIFYDSRLNNYFKLIFYSMDFIINIFFGFGAGGKATTNFIKHLSLN